MRFLNEEERLIWVAGSFLHPAGLVLSRTNVFRNGSFNSNGENAVPEWKNYFRYFERNPPQRDLANVTPVRFEEAISGQPIALAMCTENVRICGTLLIAIGTVLVLSSTWSLGITGTFLGDYFGLLLNKRVTNFPFNIMNNPMYWGSTLNFLGYSLRQCSPAGVLLTTLVAICYKIALLFEGPFTENIYAEKKLREEKEEWKWINYDNLFSQGIILMVIYFLVKWTSLRM